MDFKCPIAQQLYFLPLIEEYSRLAGVEVLSTIAASQAMPKLNCIVGTNRVPQQIKSNNEPKLNGRQFEEYARKEVFHCQLAPEQPSFNGLGKKFLCLLQKQQRLLKQGIKIFWQQLINIFKHTEPHIVTGCSPAQLLFNYQFKATIPTMRQQKFPQKWFWGSCI